MVQSIPKLHLELALIYKTKCDTQGKFGKIWTWQVKELQDSFETQVARAAEWRTIRIYIDALNECGEEAAAGLVSVFQRMVAASQSTSKSLKVCFTCRHLPLIALEDGYEICVEDENNQDIELYIQRNIETRIRQTGKMEAVRDEIAQKSNGSFQWVVLIVSEVLKMVKKGKNLASIQQRTKAVPSDLNELYSHLIRETSDEERPQALLLMQWLCFAVEPLSLENLRFAIAIDPDDPFGSTRYCTASPNFSESDEDMEKRLIDLSKGLVEIRVVASLDPHNSDPNSERPQTKRYPRLIHQSVRDFLLQQGLQLLAVLQTQV